MRLFGNQRLKAVGEPDGVAHTQELDRILALPRRDLDLHEVRVALTEHMGTPHGSQQLRSDQALFLNDLFECRGAFANMRCGSGKSLPTLLAGSLLELRTVLLVPSELIAKFHDDVQDYAEHWEFEPPEVLGYGMLSHKDHAEDLHKLAPQMILADEGQYLSNPDAACTIRVDEYLEANPQTVFGILSGTLIDTSLLRYYRLMRWALGADRMPLPATDDVAVAWAQALDPVPPMSKARLGLGALREFGDTRSEANEALGQWMAGTTGCVFSSGKGIGTSLQIRAWRPSRPPPAIRKMVAKVRQTKKRPDGVDLDDNAVVRVAGQLDLGFYLHWVPEAPKPWLKARKEWYAYCRRLVAKRYGGLDSMARIEEAIFEEGVEIRELKNWNAVRKSFRICSKPVWLDTAILEQAVAFAQSLPNCVVWTQYRCVGAKLQELGLPHFGEEGCGPNGERIEKTKAKHISASIQANAKGRNLQYQFNHSLVLTPQASAKAWEQLLAREHREGQKADTVYAHVLASRDMTRVLTEARHLGRVGGFDHKLTIADWIGFH